MISRPLMLALFVLCSAPALAAQGGEGPYLFDVEVFLGLHLIEREEKAAAVDLWLKRERQRTD